METDVRKMWEDYISKLKKEGLRMEYRNPDLELLKKEMNIVSDTIVVYFDSVILHDVIK